MGENKYIKIFSIVFFVAFAAVSCWATAESLHLLLPTWPSFACWAVTIHTAKPKTLGCLDIFNDLCRGFTNNNDKHTLLHQLICLKST